MKNLFAYAEQLVNQAAENHEISRKEVPQLVEALKALIKAEVPTCIEEGWRYSLEEYVEVLLDTELKVGVVEEDEELEEQRREAWFYQY